MMKKPRNHVDDLRGASKLAVEATKGITALVQEMQRTIGRGPALVGKPLEGPVNLVTDMVYGGIRGVTHLVGVGIDGGLEQLAPMLGKGTPGPERAALLAALNGVLGDYLDETNNPLAIEMSLGRLPPTDERPAGSKLLVMVHGSCMGDLQWGRSGRDHGAALAEELGYTPIYVQYNSGRHISTNGTELAAALESVVSSWPCPLDELVILAHSMGGLVSRSACHAAETTQLAWREQLSKMVFLGTPHHGSPLERGGNWVDMLLGVSPYSAPLARIGKIRSAGVTDLRYGNVLEEHWHGRDRFEFGTDRRSPLSLPENVACYAIAGSARAGAIGELSGDGLVPVDSALGLHRDSELALRFPTSHVWTGDGLKHMDLLDSGAVYKTVRAWLSES
jgi:pimeloyl-ACP methyl ester carboxylesterase